MADSAAAAAAPMTIDFLRARLLSERSVSRASKDRADQLATRVAELEEQVRAATAQRRQAEREAAEVLAILESQGFCGGTLSGSASDNDSDEEKDDARVTHGDAGEERQQEPPPANALSGPALLPAGGLSWKGRSVSPRKARQLMQRHRRSHLCLLASGSDPSPKNRMGQSCRKNKRKELRSATPEGHGDGGGAALVEGRKGQQNGPYRPDDGRTELHGKVGGDKRSSGDGGQYVIRYENGGEMERVLEKQAELIGQYEAEEEAQRDWERKFNDTRSSPKGDFAQAKSSGKTLPIAKPPENASEEYSEQRREAGEEHGHASARTAAISAHGSSNSSSSTSRDQQGDANSDGCPSHNMNSAASGHKSSPSSDTLVSKVSGWSPSRFHDNAGDQLEARPCLASSNAGDVDVESVLQALQRARISLQQKLGRPLPPSQVTLALPAPGDEYRGEDDLYDDGDDSSCRGAPSGSSPPRCQEMLALPAPEDYHSCHGHDHGSASLSADSADTCSLMEKRSGSSTPRPEILALPAPGEREDDDVDMKIPVSSPGLFRLPTDSFPGDEMLSGSNGCDLEELGLRVTARHDAHRDDDARVSARQFYDPQGSAPASGRCSVPAGSGFAIGGGSLLDGIPGLPEELRRGRSSLGDADLFMQRACDYTVSNKWML